MSLFHQAETNVAAHGMSSYEEARWRSADVDPVLLQDPFDVARQAEEERAREQQSQYFVDKQMGCVAVKEMFSE